MHLKQLDIINFKNIESSSISLGNKVNCFTGNNGTGKTNILDAIFYMSLCKSALGVTDGQCVRHGSDFFMLEGSYDISAKGIETIACSYKRGASKVIKRNDKEYGKLIDHVGLFPVVLVSPSDNSLIFSSDDRRRYINAFLSQIDKEYLVALMKYNSVLMQRNKLLKDIYNNGAQEILDIIDAQLCSYAKVIHSKRRDLINALSPIVEEYYSILSDNRESIDMTYDSDLNQASAEDLLSAGREKDFIMKHTTTGVHRDDISMSISGMPIRKFGSQGQQKSLLIALKLSQFDIITKHKGFKPILLLDDIFDKLDIGRVENLISMVSQDKFGQIFITDSNKIRLDSILSGIKQTYCIFDVVNGIIESSK